MMQRAALILVTLAGCQAVTAWDALKAYWR